VAHQELLSAEQKILASLGLSSNLDLTTLDPIAAAQAGDAAGAAAEVADANVYDTVCLIASALSGVGGTFSNSSKDTFVALAAGIDSSGIDLTNQVEVSRLITEVAASEQLSLPSGAADDLASVAVSSNANLDIARNDEIYAYKLQKMIGIFIAFKNSTNFFHVPSRRPQL
jgi:hypothetical protein